MSWLGKETHRRGYTASCKWGLALLLLQSFVTQSIMGKTLGNEGENGSTHFHDHQQRPFISINEMKVANGAKYSENEASLEEFQEDPVVRAKGYDRVEFEHLAFEWLSQSSSSARSLFSTESEVSMADNLDRSQLSTLSSNRELVGIEDLVDEGLYRDTFVDMCYSNLTADTTLTAGDSITTTDIFDFLTGLCRNDENCDYYYYPDGMPLNYDGLDVNIQLEWLWTICPPSWRSSAFCLEELQEEQGTDDYGLIVDNSNKWIVFNQTFDFCQRIWPFRQHTNAPTQIPTSEPSQVPSSSPSNGPSSNPTPTKSERPSQTPSASPSAEPTTSLSPSMNPTNAPTESYEVPSSWPSPQPSMTPSEVPTSHPSSSPSGHPSGIPSKNPSAHPSKAPSDRPSASPSAVPTAHPSGMPSAHPSGIPSTSPTAHPSAHPSKHPSGSPSGNPTAHPSRVPTAKPSAKPSGSPTVHPTARPSARPSRNPSGNPTAHPSSSPSESPSVKPSSDPTAHPSHAPSGMPSDSPSMVPTARPSSSPSEKPSESPSANPTVHPSAHPSAHPSGRPSRTPTAHPSAHPSARPSHVPSGTPTAHPSTHPSAHPSARPSGTPTAHPSPHPSDKPSSIPSSSPSEKPSASPSAAPTSVPSTSPSGYPSVSPSDQPTDVPTMTPTGTVLPSATPSDLPTKHPDQTPSTSPTGYPSQNPSLSIQPTEKPSSRPSVHPSGLPTSEPSDIPTSIPSARPSESPSGMPSLNPSKDPSKKPSMSPSAHPSKSPSASPSAAPSSNPTSHPSKEPSGSPSRKPSLTPTAHPSKEPSGSPSRKPSLTPTAHPSKEPSGSPSRTPSLTPTAHPSKEPSGSPSRTPSLTPTAHPSKEPSGSPSRTPSSAPTRIPSMEPSTLPSGSPISTPSIEPSLSPSVAPSSVPTGNPSPSPSVLPSLLPSVSPTMSLVPTVQPSNDPSKSPYVAPTVEPTMNPSSFPTATLRPSISPSVSLSPSSGPSLSPTTKPTAMPSDSSEPSFSPTSRVEFEISFKYVLGFNDTNFTALRLAGDPTGIEIMNSARTAIQTILTNNGITSSQRRLVMRTLVAFKDNDPNRGVVNSVLSDVNPCPPSFTVSQACTAAETIIIVQADPEKYDDLKINSELLSPIEESMESSSFLDTMNRDEVKEILFIGNDIYPILPDDDESNPVGQPIQIVAIALGSMFVIAALLLLTRSRSRDSRDVVDLEIISAGSDEAGRLYYDDIEGGDEEEAGGMKSDLRPIDERFETDVLGAGLKTESDQRPIDERFDLDVLGKPAGPAQLDLTTGAVFGNLSPASISASSGTGMSQEGIVLIDKLEEAMDAGDWGAVAALAGDISQVDDVSTNMSLRSRNTSVSGKSRDPSHLSDDDNKRLEKIDQLIAEGDWSAVGATAAAFDTQSDASSGQASKSSKGSNKSADEKKRFGRNILSFVAGPWQGGKSSAATDAMKEEEPPQSEIIEPTKNKGSWSNDSKSNDSKSDGHPWSDDGSERRFVDTNVSFSETSSLSANSPEKRKGATDQYIPGTAGTMGILESTGMANYSEEDSTITDDDEEPMLGNPKRSGWKGLALPFGKRKKEGSPTENSTNSNSLAFQEDSSVSSWSKGSSPDNTFVPYGGTSPGSRPTPPDLSALHGLGAGGYGLAAADAADEEEELRKERERLKVSDDDFSARSGDSLQDKLDQAIESGDWAAVERQANKILDTVSTDGSEKFQDSGLSVSSYDNSRDDNSRAGWESSGGQSTTTVDDSIDDERISMLEKLIETDDWQGIVTSARIYNKDDSTNASESIQGDRMSVVTGDSSTSGDIPSKTSSQEETKAEGQVWKVLTEEATEENDNDKKPKAL